MELTSSDLALQITECRLSFPRLLRPEEATRLRGFFGQVYEDERLVHNHREDGSLRYDYPRVQFKVLHQTAHVIGVAEGCQIVQRCWMETDHARLGGEDLPVLNAELGRRSQPLGETDGAIH